MTRVLMLAGVAIAVAPLMLPSEALSRDQASIVVAQQNPRQQQQRRPPPPRPPAAQPARPQFAPARPPAQFQRPVQQQRPVQRPVQQRPAVQPQRPVARPPRPPAQPQRPAARPAQRPAGQPVQRPAFQPQRPVGQPQRPVVQPRPGVQPRPVAPAQRPGVQPPRPVQPALQPGQRPPTVSVRPGTPRIDQFRGERREVRQGNRVVIREPGRTIVRQNNGRLAISHNDMGRLRLRSSGVSVERRGNETRTIINRANGVRVINVVGPNGRLIRRVRQYPNGRRVVLINNRLRTGVVLGLGAIALVAIAAPVIAMPRERYIVAADEAPPPLLYDTLTAVPVEPLDRAYALDEIRDTVNLRDRMPRIDLDSINFDTGSWEVTPQEAAKLAPIAEAMLRAIEANPDEVYMVEGYTDTVGEEVDNLSLSDRRAEAVAIVLTEQYGIPPENLTTQGYGEEHLKVPVEGAERRNRRVTIRRITPLLTGGQAAVEEEPDPPQAPRNPPG